MVSIIALWGTVATHVAPAGAVALPLAAGCIQSSVFALNGEKPISERKGVAWLLGGAALVEAVVLQQQLPARGKLDGGLPDNGVDAFDANLGDERLVLQRSGAYALACGSNLVRSNGDTATGQRIA